MATHAETSNTKQVIKFFSQSSQHSTRFSHEDSINVNDPYVLDDVQALRTDRDYVPATKNFGFGY